MSFILSLAPYPAIIHESLFPTSAFPLSPHSSRSGATITNPLYRYEKQGTQQVHRSPPQLAGMEPGLKVRSWKAGQCPWDNPLQPEAPALLVNARPLTCRVAWSLRGYEGEPVCFLSAVLQASFPEESYERRTS